MERWVAKILALVILFLVVLTATLLPIKVTGMFERQGERGARWISYLMCFGGGVFLATFGLHMGPDVRKIFEHSILIPNGIEYPLAELAILLGLFLMLFLDKIMDKVQKQQRKKELSAEKNVVAVPEHNGGDLHLETKVHKRDTENPETVPLNFNGDLEAAPHPKELEAGLGSHSTLNLSQEILPEIKSPRAMLLLLALSMDHIFEGMSVGLKHTITSVWSLTVAIIAHEVVIAFSLGMRLVKSYDSLRKILIAAIFCSVMEPLGVAIGMVLMETGGHDNPNLVIVNGVLQAISTGVFMYATFFEILRDELHGNTSITRLCFMFLGFTVLALMGLIPEGDLFQDELEVSTKIENITITTEWPLDHVNGTDYGY